MSEAMQYTADQIRGIVAYFGLNGDEVIRQVNTYKARTFISADDRIAVQVKVVNGIYTMRIIWRYRNDGEHA